MPTKEAVLQALRGVNDPELGKDIVSLKMVREVEVDGGNVRVQVMLTTPACPLKNLIEKNVRAAVMAVPGVTAVQVDLGADVAGRVKEKGERLPTVRNIIAVGSGKGGVGKSTVAVNLAIALSKTGARVGLLDADLYGPSVPIMLGIADARPEVASVDGQDRMLPLQAHGLKVFSMGFLLRERDAVVWRGPLLHKALTQFLEDVEWGDLDYLVVDLPPGTGDVQISLANLVPISSAVVVTTPQDVAFADVLRAVRMFEITKVPLLGIIENMASFVCPNCGTEHPIFGRGRIEARALEQGIAYLGSLPLDADVAPNADRGAPILIAAPDSAPAKAIVRLAEIVAAKQSVMNFQVQGPES